MRTTTFRFSALAGAIAGAALVAAPILALGAQGPAVTARDIHPTVRPGEVHAAPYIDRDGGPAGAGLVVGTSEVSVVIDAAAREHYERDEDIFITLPAGVTASIGQRLYTFALGPSFGERGQVVIPTGVVAVRRVGAGREATTVRIVELFGKVRRGQGVLPLDTAALPTNVSATAIEDGPKAKVLWIENESVVPTLQDYVVLSASTQDGVHVGDQFTLLRPPTRDLEHDVILPPTNIAVAQLVRVTAYGSTGIIIDHTQPAIEAGTAARLTARMP